MTLNEGKIDRAVRAVLGLVLLALVFVGPKTWLGWFGIIPLVTGLVGFCPLYRLVGIRTTKLASRPHHRLRTESAMCRRVECSKYE